jgi:GDPmannose 4,6-dehydratase
VEELVALAFKTVGLNWQDYVKHDRKLVTTVEPSSSCGNPSKAKRLLGWTNTVSFPEIVARMVESELGKCR